MPDVTDESVVKLRTERDLGTRPDARAPDAQPEDGGETGSLPSESLCPVVGIGASAGGLDAIIQMLQSLPATTGMAYVLVQHLDPNHESLLADLLAKYTRMRVTQATQGTKVEPNQIYVIPPNNQMAIQRGVLVLTPRGDRSNNLPIDFFLSSLAADQRSRAVGVILSGSASDGTLGLEAIKAAGGITFAQDASAKFDSMPRNAVAAGVVDFVLPPDAIAHELAGFTEHSYFGVQKDLPPVEDGPGLEKILSLLLVRTGVNFTHYKAPTVSRRLSRRMALNHIESQETYLKLLEQRPAEVEALFDDLLITVTEFFRDPATFDALGAKAFPALVKDRKPDNTIRVWVSGCSTGKEVYSIAISLLEYLENTKQSFPIQIFGTDVSERSIETARAARYSESISASVSSQRLKRFFVKIEDGYQIARSVRELCIFSRQDLTKDPPLSKMDLISCRNLLIYLDPILQRRVLSIFIYSLKRNGCLLLGNSETLGGMAEHFVVLDAKHKIYRRNLQLARPEFDLPSHIHLADPSSLEEAPLKPDDATLLDHRADRVLLEEYAPSGFLVNDSGQVVKFRGEVGPYLSPAPGAPELDVFRMVRDDIASPLRLALEEARKSNSLVRKDHVQIRRNDGIREINLVVRTIAEPANEPYFLILFEEPHQNAQAPNSGSTSMEGAPSQDYQSVSLELAATRTYMQRLIEELRSANEEAQSSNEELQSTNEELQTAKEELQSSNEELTTTNEEMNSRNSELGRLNNDLINLLSSMQTPIVMLDSELRIRRYTPIAEKTLNLIPTDIGRPISDLKPRIRVPDLEELLSRVIRSNEPLVREVQHEDGRWYSLRIRPYKTAQARVEGAVLQLLDIHQLKLTMDEAKHARDFAEAIIETVRMPLLVLDQQLQIQTANRAFFETFQTSRENTLNRSIFDLDDGQWKRSQVAQLFDSLLLDGNTAVHDLELEHEFKRVGSRTFQLNTRHLQRNGETALILLAIEDVSDRKKAAEAKYRRLFEAANDGILIVHADTGEITDVNPYLTELLGLARANLVGKPFWEVEPLKDLHTTHSAFERLQKEKVVRFPDISLKANNGRQELEVEVVANVYEEGSRRVAQFNFRDITERKHFDRQFQQTARLESLGILAGGIAHDFNNLLAGILGNAGLALGEAPPGTPYQSALKDVIYASQRAADLTRQMLAYAGKGRFNMRPLDLSELVGEISKLVQSSIPKSVELKLNLSGELPMVEADAGQMQQVVMNLVINGAEAIGDGRKGQVLVSTRVQELSTDDLRQSYTSEELKPGAYVLLEVADDGCGMDDATRARIFDPFFTTKFTGRGLGLAAVQGIVRGHHGALRVSSTPGKGSTFQLVLPAVPGSKPTPSPKPKPEDLSGTGLVLVVDDEPIVLQTTRAILERHGYQVMTAANGELGVQAVREHKDKLSLVILDLTMPVMGGEEALKQIKEETPSLPVILASGYDASQAISRFGEKALAGFIHKPSTVANLLETVKAALSASA